MGLASPNPHTGHFIEDGKCIIFKHFNQGMVVKNVNPADRTGGESGRIHDGADNKISSNSIGASNLR